MLLAVKPPLAPPAGPSTSRLRRVGRAVGVVKVAQGAALLGVVAGTVGFVSFDKAVTVTVDGRTSSVHAFGSTVADVLKSDGVVVGPHDLVSPAAGARVHDGEHLVVSYGRQMRVLVDGQPRTFWTTARTVDQALGDVGLRDDTAALSVSRDATLGRQGLALSLTTPKKVVVKVDGHRYAQTTTAATVGVFLQQLGVTLSGQDTTTVPTTMPLEAGLTVTITRVRMATKTVRDKIKAPVTRHNSAKMARGTTKVVTKGKAGQAAVTYELVYKNGKLATKVTMKRVVLHKAVRRVVLVGTKATASAGGSTGSAGDPGAVGGKAGSLNWAALAKCESGGNPKAVNPNGYYGLYQFSLSTWHSVGGSGNPINASAAEQTHRAEILYNKAGAGQWTCGSHLFD